MTPLYTGIGGVRREIKNLSCGVGGVKRDIKELWAGDGGTKRKILSSGIQMTVTGNGKIYDELGSYRYTAAQIEVKSTGEIITSRQTRELRQGDVIYFRAFGVMDFGTSADIEGKIKHNGKNVGEPLFVDRGYTLTVTNSIKVKLGTINEENPFVQNPGLIEITDI